MRRHPHKREITRIRELVDSLGGYVYVTSQAPRVSKSGAYHMAGSPGIPDTILLLPRKGLHVDWEVKVGRDTLREAQAEFLQRAALCKRAECGHGDRDALLAQFKAWGVVK